MHFAVSNIALPAFDHTKELTALPALGLTGLEVAPSRVWTDTFDGLKSADVTAYRKQVEDAGLQIIGLHSLFYDHPELGLFKDAEGRSRSLDFLVRLSAVCRDLGGRTLIWGGGRKRGAIASDAAYQEAGLFMLDLCRRIEGHGTVFCFEPLGPTDTDFINTVFDAIRVIKDVNHPALALQLDAKALVENDELRLDTFMAARESESLTHVHVNQPGLKCLDDGPVDHKKMGDFLKKIGYDAWVSIEQRLLNEVDPLSDIKRSVNVVKSCYGVS